MCIVKFVSLMLGHNVCIETCTCAYQYAISVPSTEVASVCSSAAACSRCFCLKKYKRFQTIKKKDFIQDTLDLEKNELVVPKKVFTSIIQRINHVQPLLHLQNCPSSCVYSTSQESRAKAFLLFLSKTPRWDAKTRTRRHQRLALGRG